MVGEWSNERGICIYRRLTSDCTNPRLRLGCMPVSPLPFLLPIVRFMADAVSEGAGWICRVVRSGIGTLEPRRNDHEELTTRECPKKLIPNFVVDLCRNTLSKFVENGLFR